MAQPSLGYVQANVSTNWAFWVKNSLLIYKPKWLSEWDTEVVKDTHVDREASILKTTMIQVIMGKKNYLT